MGLNQSEVWVALSGIEAPAAIPFHENLGDAAGIVRAAVLAGAIAITLLLGAVTFALGRRHRIPSTQMSSLLLIALFASAAALCVITARTGWLILQHSSHHSLPTLGMAAALFSPTLCLCGWYVASWWQAGPQARGEQKSLNNLESLKVIRRLARDMGLPPDTVERTVEVAQGPFVRGTSARRFQLCLRYDLDDRAMRACGGNRQRAAGLLRLVLAHELAHLRNGDICFMPLLVAARQTLPFCFGVIAIAALLVGGHGLEAKTVGLARGMVGIMMVGGIAVWILAHLALRERERLADATATLFVNPDTVGELTGYGNVHETELPPLMAFLTALRLGWPAPKRVLGFGGASWWQPWVKPAGIGSNSVEFENEVAPRALALESKLHTAEEFPAQSWVAAVAAGILGGLLLGAFAHYLVLEFFVRLLDFQGNPTNPVNAGFLKAHQAWSQEQSSSLVWSLTRTLAPLLSAMLLVSTVMLPWRDAVRKLGFANEPPWRNMLAVCLAALVLAGVVLEFTSPGHLLFPLFPTLRVSGLALWGWSAVAALMFGGMLVFRPYTRRLRPILLQSLFIVALVIANGAVCMWLLQGLSFAGRLMWATTLILMPSVLLTMGSLSKILALEDYSEESIRFVRVFGFARLFCNPLGGELKLTRSFVGWLTAYTIAAFCLPGLLLAFPLSRSLLRYDMAGYEPARTQGIAEVQLSETAPGRDPAEDGTSSSKFRARSVQAGPRPSTWLGMIALGLATLLGFCVTSARALLIPRKNTRVLASAAPMEELFSRLDLPKVQTHFKSRLAVAVEGNCKELKDASGVPLLIQTCRVLECCYRLGVADTKRPAMLSGVLACESSRGGFGPNRRATLQHTVAVLRMLRRLSARPVNDWDIHEQWVRRVLTDCWRKRLVMTPSAWLEAVSLISEELEQTDGTLNDLASLKRLGRQMGGEAFRRWQASEQSTMDTKHLVTILGVWRPVDRSLAAELQTSWGLAWEKHLATLHPETELKELADSVTLLSRLFPSNYAQRGSVVQVVDNLEKHWVRSA